MTADSVKKNLRRAADKEKAAFFPRFFKTGKGQYGEGDVFMGVTVPKMRMIARDHRDLPLEQVAVLLADPVHECRLTALLILGEQYDRGTPHQQKRVATFYLSHLSGVNNWDLVDSSAYRILGTSLVGKNWKLLKRMARSKNLWEQRIAMVATLAFIRAGDMAPTIAIAEMFLDHAHDLMHKATGWMLREMGKKDQRALIRFLDRHAAVMPRTALRYALERLGETERTRYMQRKKNASKSPKSH